MYVREINSLAWVAIIENRQVGELLNSTLVQGKFPTFIAIIKVTDKLFHSPYKQC